MVTTHTWTKGDHCRVDGWAAIACWFIEQDDDGWAVVVMVGDDARHDVEVQDLIPLDDDEFCGGCGQIGCNANG